MLLPSLKALLADRYEAFCKFVLSFCLQQMHFVSRWGGPVCSCGAARDAAPVGEGSALSVGRQKNQLDQLL